MGDNQTSKPPQLLTFSRIRGIQRKLAGGVDDAPPFDRCSARKDALSDDAWLLFLDQLCELSEHDFDTLVVAARAARRFEEGSRGRRDRDD